MTLEYEELEEDLLRVYIKSNIPDRFIILRKNEEGYRVIDNNVVDLTSDVIKDSIAFSSWSKLVKNKDRISNEYKEFSYSTKLSFNDVCFTPLFYPFDKNVLLKVLNQVEFIALESVY